MKKYSSLLEIKTRIFKDIDSSLWFLIFSNIVTIFFASVQDWDMQSTMWIYWSQSISIGFFNFIQILKLKNVSPKVILISGDPVQLTKNGTKLFVGLFFLIHYGFFHFGYLTFLINDNFSFDYKNLDFYIDHKYILLIALLFFVSHFLSYFNKLKRDSKEPDIDTLFIFPYPRIIPMHLIIVLGYTFQSSIMLFLVLKTISDVIMQIIENSVQNLDD